MEGLIESAETLHIEHDKEELRVDDGHGRVRIFYLDGEKHIRQTPGGTKLETVCTAGSRYILVEQKMDRGGKISENYVLLPEGDRMELTVRLEIRQFRKPVVVRSVYERDP